MREYKIDKTNNMVRFYFKRNDPDYDSLRRDVGDISKDTHWNPQLLCWITPFNVYVRNQIEYFVEKYGFEFSPELEVSFKKYDHSVATDIMEKMIAVCGDRNFLYDPRPYQYEALYYALDKHSFINGDDVGLGKTFEAIIYTEVLRAFPAIVVVPASVKYNWGEKWAEIVGEHRTISVIESAKKNKNNWDADVIIINYDILAGELSGRTMGLRFEELYRPFAMYIFDEAHYLKDKKSKRSKAVKTMVKNTTSPRQALTGTAIMSKPAELWNILTVIGKEHLISDSEMNFQYRYCAGYRGKFGMKTDGATNTLELNHKLRNNCYLRREKREVLTDMPPVTTDIMNFPITNIKAINDAQNDLYTYLLENKGEESAESALNAESLVLLGVLRKLSISGKMKAIIQYLDDWLLTGKKLVVFGLHREELELLAERYKSLLIAGGMDSEKKQATVKKWCNNDDVFIFCNITSAGTGVDGFQYVCSNMLILELPWRPSDLVQTIGRIDRSGQKEPCNIIFALSQSTIDVEMWEMIQEKEVTAEAVNKGIDIEKEDSGMKVVMKKYLSKKKLKTKK